MRALSAAILMATAAPALAWSDLDRMETATQLGTVLAAEALCGLSYNQAAISAYIEQTVPADDMGFAPMLSTMTQGAAFNQQGMAQSQKTAHCTQIKRAAKAFGFVD